MADGMGTTSVDFFWDSTDWHLQNTIASNSHNDLLFNNKVFAFLGFQYNCITHKLLLVSMSKHILQLGGSVFKWPECQKFGKISMDINYFITNYSQGFLSKPLDVSVSKLATPLWLYFSCIDNRLYPIDYIPFFKPSKYFKPLEFQKHDYKICLFGFTALKRVRKDNKPARSKFDMQVHLHFLRHAGISYYTLADLSSVDYVVCGRNFDLKLSSKDVADKPIISVDWIYEMYHTGRNVPANSYDLNLSINLGLTETNQILSDYKIYISHMAIITYRDLLDLCIQMGASNVKVVNPISLLTEEMEMSDKEILLICHPNEEYPDLDQDPNIHPSYGLVNYISNLPQDEYVAYNVSLIKPESIYEAKRLCVLDINQLLQMDTYVESVRVDKRCEADSTRITINDLADSVSYKFQDIFCEASLDNVERHSFMKIVMDYQELSTRAEIHYRNDINKRLN